MYDKKIPCHISGTTFRNIENPKPIDNKKKYMYELEMEKAKKIVINSYLVKCSTLWFNFERECIKILKMYTKFQTTE